MYELIITEKPSASLKIATALADKDIKKELVNKVPYYKLKHKNKEIVVACAVGHLYNLAESEKNGWTYPTFNISWKESSEISKSAAFTKNYLKIIQKLAKDANKFTIATDYDVEGEVIGLNVLRFACKQKDASRMKYSTLTKDELINSYEHASKTINWPQAEAGETRHFLDYYYGINLSRALTLAIKTTGAFKILSSGRVQGPALKIIVEKEKNILAFKSVPYYEIELATDKLNAFHKEGKIFDKNRANELLKNTKNKKAIIKNIEKIKIKQAPPHPFDLTALQLEAYRTMGISPKETLSLAQSLYLAGLISYPRTSSNQLPISLDYKKIIKSLSKQSKYKELCEELLKKELKPNNGTKQDPAHPAIYPTGEIPSKLNDRESKIYELIVSRTLATFAKEATRESATAEIDINKEIFIARGIITLDPGWFKFYGRFAKFKEQELPSLKLNEELKVKDILLRELETQPPKRYTPASIIKELEKRNLGTKATRAEIIDSLYQRDYIYEKSIQATNLGIKIVETLEKYCPEIQDEELTRHFEKDMHFILHHKKHKEEILEESKKILTNILIKFKKNESNIGKELLEATRETQKKESIVGKCRNCSGDLVFKKGKFGLFVACNNYPKCKTTFSLTKHDSAKPSNKTCKECGFPTVYIYRKGKRPFEYCINKNCKLKLDWKKKHNIK
jgi:DNA topoisomerase-1